MQDKKPVDVKKILLALAKHLGVKGIRGLAQELGESENRLYAWVKNGNIADTGAILVKCPTVRRGWLQTGEGDMFETKYKEFVESKESEWRERARRDGVLNQPRHPDPTIQAVIEMMEKMDQDTKEDVRLSVEKEKLLRDLLKQKVDRDAS